MARHKAQPFASWLLVALTGCGSWPRFAQPYQPPEISEGYSTFFQLKEDPGDFLPGAPPSGEDKAAFAAPTNKVLKLDRLFGAAQVLGAISSTEGRIAKNEEPFSDAFCPGEQPTFGVQGNYKGDVDFIKLDVGTSGLCMVLSDPEASQNLRGPSPTTDTGTGATGTADTGTPNTGETQPSTGEVEPEEWHVIALPWDEGKGCISDSFFYIGQGEFQGDKPAIQDEYSKTRLTALDMPDALFATLATGQPLGPVVVMIALATNDSGPRPYSLHLLPTRDDPRSCRTMDENGEPRMLTADDFAPYSGNP